MNRTQKRLPLIIMGAVVALAGIAATFGKADPSAATAITSAGTVMLVIGIISGLRPERETRPDERVRSIAARSSAWSWAATFLVLNILLWNDILNGVALSTRAVIGIVFATMIVSMLASRAYLNRTGDVA